ncbi:MAG: hypothetical protein NW217_13050 [Hyphomicrobiaceae bacterium]|nr:hypothetical protein [Hyphomicrobiaceae bacterium]
MRAANTVIALALMASSTAVYSGLFGSDLTGSRGAGDATRPMFADLRTDAAAASQSGSEDGAPGSSLPAPATLTRTTLAKTALRSPSGVPLPAQSPLRLARKADPETSPAVRVAGYLALATGPQPTMPLPVRAPGKLQRMSAADSALAPPRPVTTAAHEPGYPTPRAAWTTASETAEVPEADDRSARRSPAAPGRPTRHAARFETTAAPPAKTVTAARPKPARSSPRQARRPVPKSPPRVASRRRPVGIVHVCTAAGCRKTPVYRPPGTYRQFQAHRNRVIANAIRRNRARMGLLFY